jgi:ATP-binding cassette, subfamily B (MDR/TAP), member 1
MAEPGESPKVVSEKNAPQEGDTHVPAVPPPGAAADAALKVEDAVATAGTNQPTSEDSPAAKNDAGLKNIFRILKYTSTLDRWLMAAGIICSCGAGMALPLMNIVFGRLVTSFNSYFIPNAGVAKDAFLSNVNRNALYIFILFLAKFALTYVSIFAFRMTGIRISASIRMAYLEALFAQPISKIDRLPSGMATDQLTTTANSIQIAFSDKLATLFQSMSLVVSAFVVAFIYSWALTLVSGSLVLYVIAVYAVIVPMWVKVEGKIQKNNSQASGVAGEVLKSARTVKSLCAESFMIQRYTKWVLRARKYGFQSAWATSAIYSQAFFPVYADMGLTFWFGVKLYSQNDISSVGNVIM